MTFQIEAPLLMWESFWKGVVFWFEGCSCHFYPKKKYGSKDVPFRLTRKGVAIQRIVDTIFVSKKGSWLEEFLKNGRFSVNVPQGINQGDFRVSRFWDLYFWLLKGFGRFEAIASLDAYQITICQTFQKLIIIFFCLIFKKFEKKNF